MMTEWPGILVLVAITGLLTAGMWARYAEHGNFGWLAVSVASTAVTGLFVLLAAKARRER